MSIFLDSSIKVECLTIHENFKFKNTIDPHAPLFRFRINKCLLSCIQVKNQHYLNFTIRYFEIEMNR